MGRGKKFYPGKEKSGPANIFLLPPKPSAPADPTIHCEAGRRRLDWRQLWREGPRLRWCSPATSLDFKQEPPPLQLGSTGRGDRATPRQAREGPEDLGGAPPACTLALSRPLATSQNKLFNATVSVSCEKRPFQIWRMSPLLRLSQKS